MGKSSDRLTSQAVGAYGERVVEAELLRRGWIVSNVNSSVKNAAVFDILAWKGNLQPVPIRVKTCGPRHDAFQFGGKPGEIKMDDLRKVDFTVLVAMGKERANDRFYILPTRVVRKTIAATRKAYLAIRTRTGSERKDTGQWTLNLRKLRSGEDRPQRGLAEKWKRYLDGWALLEDLPAPRKNRPMA